MAAAKITLIGFYNYMDSVGDDLFGNLQVPTGIDKDELINNILMRGGEYETLYGDPYFMKNMIGVWSKKWQHTMQKWYEAINAQFDPVENYDRMEEWTDTNSKVSSGQTSSCANSSESTERNENAIANDHSISNGSGETTNTRSAFDSGTYQPHDKSNTASDGENTSSSLSSANGNTETKGNTSNEISENSIDNALGKHQGRIHGNIGVKTAQSMIEESLKLFEFNVYDGIADLFISELLIYVD